MYLFNFLKLQKFVLYATIFLKAQQICLEV